MSVGKIASRVVQTTTPHEKVRQAARRMQEHNVGTLVVMDLAGKPAGLITDRDLAMRCIADDLDPDWATVSRIMTSPATTVDEDTPIETAIRTMADAQVRRLVVVDRNGGLAGMLSLDDVLDLIVEETESIGMLLRGQTPV